MKFKVDAFIAVFKNMKAEIVTGRNLLSDMLSYTYAHENVNTYIHDTYYRGKVLSDDTPRMYHVAVSVLLNN